MTTDIQKNSETTLLLSLRLDRKTNPLTDEEIRAVYSFLHKQNKQPCDLMLFPEELFAELEKKIKISSERLSNLLKRGNALALYRGKWANSGIWVKTRCEKDFYTSEFTENSKNNDLPLPAVIFGCGSVPNLSGPYEEIATKNSEYPAEILEMVSESSREGVYLLRSVNSSKLFPLLGIVDSNLEEKVLDRNFGSLIRKGELSLISINSPSAFFQRSHKRGETEVFLRTLVNQIPLLSSRKQDNPSIPKDTKATLNQSNTIEGTMEEEIRKTEQATKIVSEEDFRLDGNPTSSEKRKINKQVVDKTKVKSDQFFLLLTDLIRKVAHNPVGEKEIRQAISSSQLLTRSQLKRYLDVAVEADILRITYEQKRTLYVLK